MTTVSERLDEAMEPEDLVPGSPSDRPWSIEDAGGADWTLRKLARLRGELADVHELAEQQVAQVRQWEQNETDRLTPSIAFFEEHLARYHRRRLDEDAKAKTIRLPHGTLAARQRPDNVEIADTDALLKWAVDGKRYGLYREKYTLDRESVKHAVLKDGEALPGVTPVVGEVKFSASTEVEGVAP